MEIDRLSVVDNKQEEPEPQINNLGFDDEGDEDPDEGLPEPVPDNDDEETPFPILETFKFRNHLFSIELSSRHFKLPDLIDMSLTFMKMVNPRPNKKFRSSFYG